MTTVLLSLVAGAFLGWCAFALYLVSALKGARFI